jgi:hypothetical protein
LSEVGDGASLARQPFLILFGAPKRMKKKRHEVGRKKKG